MVGEKKGRENASGIFWVEMQSRHRVFWALTYDHPKNVLVMMKFWGVLAAFTCLLASGHTQGPSVLVLRGDSFRWGKTSSSGCQTWNTQAVKNQLHTLESMERFVIEPLHDHFHAVLVTGLVYACKENQQINDFFQDRSKVVKNAVHIHEVQRQRNVSQRTLFRTALSEAASRHRSASFFMVVRLDQTFGENVVPTADWQNSALLPWANSGSPPDQIFGFGRNILSKAMQVLAIHDTNVSHVRYSHVDVNHTYTDGTIQRFFQGPLEALGVPIGYLFPEMRGLRGSCTTRPQNPLPYADCFRCTAPFCLPNSSRCTQKDMLRPSKHCDDLS